jgi:flagellar biosynthesis protein FlhF
MKIETILAADSREARKKLREHFGDDALILSSTMVDGQIRLVATVAGDLKTLVDVADGVSAEREAWAAPEPAKATVAPLAAGASLDPNVILDELRKMRTSMASQLAEIQLGTSHHRDPFRAEAMRQMLAAGFGPLLSRYLSEKMPALADNAPADAAIDWIRETLAANVTSLTDDAELVGAGGVIALVGPTGVGKTTTTAKLAARFVSAHGSANVAMITTDMYRIGALEQLNIYGRILRIPVHAVNDEQELQAALRDLQNRHTVLIDTVGMSQRDVNVAKQVQLLANGGREVKRILCLNSAATGETLDEVVKSYSSGGLSGCILTKLDEAATMGGVLDVLVRNRIKVFYVATGQRVPEDMTMTTGADLVDRVFDLAKNVRSSPFEDGELSLIGSGEGGAVDVAAQEVVGG